MDDLYDEFGNYQGPPLSGSEVLDRCSVHSSRRRPCLPCVLCFVMVCFSTQCFFPFQDEEEEELDEVEEAEDLEDAEEAADRRMDMTSEGCI